MKDDVISRQAAIELAMQYCPDDDGTCSKADEDIRNLLDELEALPSAQPEIVRCWECFYRRRCMLQHFVESNAVDGKPIDWSEWYCADGVRDISKSDERQEKK